MKKIPELLSLAENFYSQGNYRKALKYAEKILKKESENITALLIKGNVYYQNHKMQESLNCYLKILEKDSLNKNALINIGNIYFEQKNYEQSYRYSKLASEVDSHDKTALMIYGNSALELEKYEEGKRAFICALEDDSQDAWCYNFLSRIYQKTEDAERALACGWQAVVFSGGDKNHHINFGYLLYELGLEKMTDSLKKYAEIWLEKYGENNIVEYMANAILNKQKITRADAVYVREIFDAFSDDFETVLMGLDYCAPQVIEEEIIRLSESEKISKLKILDAGCGTGLCGEFLKKHKSFHGLYGIDISEKMLEKAKLKKCYDKLINAELESYFETNKKRFDLIVSADVFTYFGDLKKLLTGCAKSLEKNGRIIFTVSANLSNENDYFLHASGRFLHHKNYIKNILENIGFCIEKKDEKVLRKEGGEDVVGYLFSARKK